MKHTWKVIYRGEWKDSKGRPTTISRTWESESLIDALQALGWDDVVRAYKDGEKLNNDTVHAAAIFAKDDMLH